MRVAVVVETMGEEAHRRLEEGTRWRVMGVFRRAANLVDARGHVVGLLAHGRRGPVSLCAPGLAEFLPRLRDGQDARVSGGGMVVEEAGLRLDWTGAARWSPPAFPPRPEWQPGGWDALVEETGRLALAAKEPRGFVPLFDPARPACDTPLLRRAAGLIDALEVGLRREDAAAIREAAAGLIGLGDGLTPSGDDLLTGLAYTLFHAAPGLARPLSDAISVSGAASTRTNAVSTNQLELAARGIADEALCLAVGSLFRADVHAARRVGELLEWGASSGADMLLGVHLAVRAL